MNAEMKINQAKLMLEGILNDPRVPRNVKRVVQEALDYLNNESIEPEVRASSAITNLDEISTDVNLPLYARTQIWNIVTVLEEARREFVSRKSKK